jgi:hypothetical protein
VVKEIKPKPLSSRSIFKRKPKKFDDSIFQTIKSIEERLHDSIQPLTLNNLDDSKGTAIMNHFEKSQEYQVKSYREKDATIFRVYPVGKLRRLAEQKKQEVLMKGKPEILPPMGSFERFIIHDYLKERDGIRTESYGEKGKDRHIEIFPLFGRNLKKIKKRKLTR